MPYFVVDGEPIWGVDRMWMVEHWARGTPGFAGGSQMTAPCVYCCGWMFAAFTTVAH